MVRAKSGTIVLIIAPGESVVDCIKRDALMERYRLDQISEWRDRAMGRRRRSWAIPRYLVAVARSVKAGTKPMLYLPRPEKLKPA